MELSFLFKSDPSVGVIGCWGKVSVGDSSVFLDLTTRLHVRLDFKRQSLETQNFGTRERSVINENY